MRYKKLRDFGQIVRKLNAFKADNDLFNNNDLLEQVRFLYVIFGKINADLQTCLENFSTRSMFTLLY